MESSAPSDWDQVRLLSDVLLQKVVPIFANDWNDRPRHVGCGFLLRQADSLFLISAGHVLNEMKGHQLFYYLSASEALMLRGSPVIDDKHDVAVLQLPASASLPKVESGKGVLEPKHLRRDLHPRSRYTYGLVGYPASRTKASGFAKHVVTEGNSWVGEGAPDDAYEPCNADPKAHILVKFTPKAAFTGPDSAPIRFPAPRGMSGAPVWALYSTSRDEFVVSVVGIATDHLKEHRTIQATDVGFALNLINQIQGEPDRFERS